MSENLTEARQLVRDGVAYMSGAGVEKNEATAFVSFWRAAQLKDPVGEFMVGVCYDRGWGTTQNTYEAFRWYELAAEHGLPEAQFNLGVCLQRGEGVTEDIPRAVGEYEKALQKGLPVAVYNYAICTEFGVGVEQDKQAAQELYAAIADGFPMAAERVDKKEIRAGLLNMLLGLGIAVAGGVASAISYSNAGEGEKYTVFTGLIVVGGFMFLAGVFNFLKGLGNSAASAVSKTPDPNQALADRLDRLETVDLFEEETEEEAEAVWTNVDYSKVRNLTSEILTAALPDVPFALDLSYSAVTDDVLETLRGNVNLRNVDLSGCKNVTPTGLRNLSECPKLRILSIGSNPDINQETGMVTFKNFKNVDDSWLEVISGMSQLTGLAIAGCPNITDEGVAQLERLTQLTSFNLISCSRITDEGYGLLRSMPRLKSIEIGSSKMTGRVLACLKGAIQLKSLLLYNPAAIRDEDIAQLAELPMLQELNCTVCSFIPKSRVKKWGRMLPNCQVLSGPATGTGINFSGSCALILFLILAGTVGLLAILAIATN